MNLFKLLAVAICFVLLSPFGVQSESKYKAPNFVLKTQDGKTLELKKLTGKVVVVNFWATWCGPCRAEIPGMIDVYRKYGSKVLEIVGVSLDQGGWDQVKPFLEKMKIPYPIVIGDEKLVDAYGGIDAVPTTFFISKEGNVVERHIGYMSTTQFEGMIKKLL